MKHLLTLLLLIFSGSNISFSQEHTVNQIKYIFDPGSDAKEDLKKALSTAKNEHKNVMILVGGDWSNSSIVFDRMLTMGYLKPYMDAHYVFMRVNFTPDNKNEAVLAPYDSPKHEGYPIIIILDQNGNKIVAKNCDEYMISYKLPYSEPKILKALQSWVTN